MLIAVRGMHKAALLVSGVTPEEVFYIAHVGSILGGSPLSRLGSLIRTAMVPRVASSGAVGVQVLVTLLHQWQVQQKYRQVLVGERSCLALRSSRTLISHVWWDLGYEPEKQPIATVTSGRQSPYHMVQVGQ